MTNGTEAGTQQATINVIDDDAAYVILSTNTGNIAESGGVALVTVEILSGVTSNTGIDVTLSYTGTATNGADYMTGTTIVTIVA